MISIFEKRNKYDIGGDIQANTELEIFSVDGCSVDVFLVQMGLNFIRNTCTAAYRKGNTLVTAFLSQRDSAESARATVVRYTKYANKYGKGIDRLKAGEVELVSCDMGGSYDVGSDIYYKGSERNLAPFLKDHRDQVWVV